VTDAHFQTLALHERLRLWFPAHEPREKDPHYKLFHQAKARMKQLDVPCWRCGVHYADLNSKLGMVGTERNPLGAHQLEAHHQEIEFSLSNAVDVEHWFQASTEDVNDAFKHVYSDVDGFLHRHPELDPTNHRDVFDAYVESEGNLQQLCDVCHRSTEQGVHHIPYPEWRPLAVWRQDLPVHVQSAG
jgi:hypothetical protein